jgi:hypothetical protein
VLHTEPPPVVTLNRLLSSTPILSPNYGHLLLEQQVASIDDADADQLRPYFESAHLDAREVFHRAARIKLHPEAGAPGAHATYPNCLPPKAIRGLFGEVMAGLISEAYSLVGGKTWRIPIFLFRYHGPVERYIFDLVRDPTKVKEVHGRPGNDFIGLELASNGRVSGFIAGEAKWRTDLRPSGMTAIMKGGGTGKGAARVYHDDGVWNDINTALAVPQGLQQMCDLLVIKDRDGHAMTILSLDEALLGQTTPPRTDLVLVGGNRATSRAAGTAYLPTAAPPPDYKAGRPLQIVELVLTDGEKFIDRLYRRLWT